MDWDPSGRCPARALSARSRSVSTSFRVSTSPAGAMVEPSTAAANHRRSASPPAPACAITVPTAERPAIPPAWTNLTGRTHAIWRMRIDVRQFGRRSVSAGIVNGTGPSPKQVILCRRRRFTRTACRDHGVPGLAYSGHE
jgi:hypothetical protein